MLHRYTPGQLISTHVRVSARSRSKQSSEVARARETFASAAVA